MASREEVIGGIEFLIQESKRLGSQLNEADWAQVVDMDGWKNREVLAHIAGISAIVAPMVTSFTNAPAGTNAGAGVDIDALNAGIVGARAGKSVEDLVNEVATGYNGVIEFVRGASAETLAKQITFAGYKDVPVSEILMRMVVLHGLGHVYSSYAAVMNAGT